jgi:hypothetical protein
MARGGSLSLDNAKLLSKYSQPQRVADICLVSRGVKVSDQRNLPGIERVVHVSNLSMKAGLVKRSRHVRVCTSSIPAQSAVCLEG